MSNHLNNSFIRNSSKISYLKLFININLSLNEISFPFPEIFFIQKKRYTISKIRVL